jgi:hypothetical protein
VIRFGIILTLAFVFPFAPPLFSKENEKKPMTVSSVDDQISQIRSTLKRVLEELARAKGSNDVKRVNCLQSKVNLVKGLLKASEKANIVFLEASYAKDASTAESYGRKIQMYAGSVEEISRSIDECSAAEVTSEGSTLVYIRPEEPELAVSETSPWGGTDGIGGTEGYPVVPPASPFR